LQSNHVFGKCHFVTPVLLIVERTLSQPLQN